MLRHQTSSKVGAVTAVAANKVLNVIDRDGALAKASRSKVGRVAKAPANAAMVVLNVPGLVGATIADGIIRKVTGRESALNIRPDKEAGPVAEVPVRMELEDTSQDEPAMVEREMGIKVYKSKDDPNTTCFGVPFSAVNPDVAEGWEKTITRSKGGEVTATRLRRRSLIPQEYYFKGELSDADAVRVATKNQPAHKTANYAGEVSPREGLSPVAGLMKKNLIKQSLGLPISLRSRPLQREI